MNPDETTGNKVKPTTKAQPPGGPHEGHGHKGKGQQPKPNTPKPSKPQPK